MTDIDLDEFKPDAPALVQGVGYFPIKGSSGKACTWCRKPQPLDPRVTEDFFQCWRCTSRYCSRECAALDWDSGVHKAACHCHLCGNPVQMPCPCGPLSTARSNLGGTFGRVSRPECTRAAYQAITALFPGLRFVDTYLPEAMAAAMDGSGFPSHETMYGPLESSPYGLCLPADKARRLPYLVARQFKVLRDYHGTGAPVLITDQVFRVLWHAARRAPEATPSPYPTPEECVTERDTEGRLELVFTSPFEAHLIPPEFDIQTAVSRWLSPLTHYTWIGLRFCNEPTACTLQAWVNYLADTLVAILNRALVNCGDPKAQDRFDPDKCMCTLVCVCPANARRAWKYLGPLYQQLHTSKTVSFALNKGDGLTVALKVDSETQFLSVDKPKAIAVAVAGAGAGADTGAGPSTSDVAFAPPTVADAADEAAGHPSPSPFPSPSPPPPPPPPSHSFTV